MDERPKALKFFFASLGYIFLLMIAGLCLFLAFYGLLQRRIDWRDVVENLIFFVAATYLSIRCLRILFLLRKPRRPKG